MNSTCPPLSCNVNLEGMLASPGMSVSPPQNPNKVPNWLPNSFVWFIQNKGWFYRWAYPKPKCQDALQRGQRIRALIQTQNPQGNMKLSLEDRAFECSFPEIHPKLRDYRKKKIKRKQFLLFSTAKHHQTEVGSGGKLCPAVYHSRRVGSAADPRTSENDNPSWKFITNYG